MQTAVTTSSTYPVPSDNWLQDDETGFLYQPDSSAAGLNIFSIVKKKAFLDHYKASFPDMTDALEQVGVSRRTVYWHMKIDAAFKEAIEELREVRVDKVESRLYKDALTPKQFMAQIAVLRAYRPVLYTERKVILGARDLDPTQSVAKKQSLASAIDTDLIQDARISTPEPGNQLPGPSTQGITPPATVPESPIS